MIHIQFVYYILQYKTKQVMKQAIDIYILFYILSN